jgi:prepilin-type N-terminal cleavage/methylation domain-containing protein
MNHRISQKLAFTLVELLVTIAIIGILSGIASITYSGVQARSRDAQRTHDLAQLKIALSTYFTSQVPNGFVVAASAVTINGMNDPLTAALTPSYMKTVPVDPINSGNFVYKYQSLTPVTIGGNVVYKNFNLFATFENKLDKKGWGGGSSWVVDGYVVQND